PLSRPPSSPIFPYTTLFRSEVVEYVLLLRQVAGQMPGLAELAAAAEVRDGVDAAPVEPQAAQRRKTRLHADAIAAIAGEQYRMRSEEHTSELQSQSNLVCRL